LTALAQAHGGRFPIHWYAAPTGGTRLADNHPLTTGYFYADNCAGQAGRVPLWVDVVACPLAGSITTWTTAMYDFQTQTLSYFIAGGTCDAADSWRWYVNTHDGRDYQPISGATNSTFLIPANFMYGAYTNIAQGATTPGMAEFHFRVVRENSLGFYTTSASFGMYFIRTNTSGFNHDFPASLLLHRTAAAGGDTHMALLNLGATAENSLGSLFQWGRRADGHQEIDWVKNPADGAAVLGPVAAANHRPRPTATTNFDAISGQPLIDVTQFFTGSGSFTLNTFNDLWGNGISEWSASALANPTVVWTPRGQSNNPCPAGWRIPSRFEWLGVGHGNVANPPGFVNWNSLTSPPSGNTWRGRSAQNGAVGGAIITNQNGESVFLPAVRMRLNGAGTLATGANGEYWTSTDNSATPTNTFGFTVTTNGIQFSTVNRSSGMSVRCIAE